MPSGTGANARPIRLTRLRARWESVGGWSPITNRERSPFRASSRWRHARSTTSELLGSTYSAASNQHDRVHVAAVIGLAAMGGAAETEKPGGVGIGAKGDILDLLDAGAGEPRADIAGEIEHGMTLARRGFEEASAGGVLGG